MLIFQRKITEQILSRIKNHGLIIILGPRQAGKTTLVKNLLKTLNHEDAYFNCELNEVRRTFVLGDPKPLRTLIGDHKVVAFDEAQTITNIGKILKIFHDTYPDIKVIATGSSAFDLANKIREPLTGRADEFMLYPLSLAEIGQTLTMNKRLFQELLQYGTYPAVATASTPAKKEMEIKRIATNYLYKDIFTFEALRNPKSFEDLVTHLATRSGNIIHTSDLAREVGIAPKTTESYIRLLEQAFVIKRVYSFARNYANELKKSYKIFFIDNGVRNVFANLPKNDNTTYLGTSFEALIFSEFLKKDTLTNFPPRTYFWRTTGKQEIDFVRIKDTAINAYEVKYSHTNVAFTLFKKHYPTASTHIITPESILPTCTIPDITQ